MRNRNCVILLLCISIILSGCNPVEESTNSSASSSATTDTTTSNEVTETPTDSSLITIETETSITYESYSIPEGLSREEIYEDVGYTLLTGWSRYFYIDCDRHIYLREYSEFSETMMLELLYTALLLYIPPTLSGRSQIFDNCHRNEGQTSIDYTIQAMRFLFNCEISREQIEELLSASEDDSYTAQYDESTSSLIREYSSLRDIEVEITDTNVENNDYDFVTDCSIVSSDDTSCTYDVYWTPGSSGEHLTNGRLAPVRDIATITVTFDFDDSYDLGFIITDIQVERAQ
ncbi:MAG: hypothetical protein GXZ12_00065 [Clostridiaceae bacterium]|jgi:hypothetical protein|nr:hypothetical protein [Clostridiaceae bacterium]HOO48989.1 hypothetical protein [Saccharofermentans sp.]HPQ32218.1 hypothetical protein [Saccharofermentans sp.]HRV51120.1 hypothetical protein [Saccharofermentans sp.]